MALEQITYLGPDQQNREWVSTLSGAHYRWAERWEVRRAKSDQWYPAYSVSVASAYVGIYAYGGEKFEEVPSA